VIVKGVEVDERVGDPEAHCVRVVTVREGCEEVWEAKYVLVSICFCSFTSWMC
jgi:phenol 2-monooxygenase